MVGTSVLFKLLDLLLSDDDEPFDSKLALENKLKELLGQTGAALATKGVGAGVGVDISRRVGLGDVFSLQALDAPPGTDGKDYLDYMTLQLLGPFYSVGSGAARGLEDLEKGDTLRGLEGLLPRGCKDLVKATRIGSEGMRTRAGKRLLEDEAGDPGDILMLALGFSPEEISAASEREMRLNKMSSRIADRRSELVRDLVQALESGDVEALTEARAEIVDFNRRMPAFAVRGADVRGAYNKRRRGDQMIDTRRERAVERQFGI
jgi:hypothetical protein